MNAFPVQPPESISQQMARLCLRPLRVCYVVNRTVDENILNKVLQYNTSLWGGRYNLFVPTDGERIREDWLHLLLRHDADMVVYVGDVDKALPPTLYNQLQPFSDAHWGDDWLKDLERGLDRLNAMSMHTLLRAHSLTGSKVQPQESNALYPQIRLSRFERLFAFLLGVYPENSSLSSAYKTMLGAADAAFMPTSLHQYLSDLDSLKGKITPLSLTGHWLQERFANRFDSFFPGPHLILTDGLVDDLFLYHCARWATTARQERPCAVIPIQDLEGEAALDVLVEWLHPKLRGNLISLASTQVDLETLSSIREQLRRKLLSAQNTHWSIPIQQCDFVFRLPQVFHRETDLVVRVDGDKRMLRLPTPDFNDVISRFDGWVAELDLGSQIDPEKGFVPSKFPDLNRVLSGTQDHQPFSVVEGSGLRMSRKCLAGRVGGTQHTATFRLPTKERLMTLLSENAGYRVQIDEKKARFYTGMVRMLGGLDEVVFLQQESMLRLFSDAQFKKGRAYTARELKALAGIRENPVPFFDQLRQLTLKEVLLRGYSLRCPRCDLDAWYTVESVKEVMTCVGCRVKFQLPLEMPFSYRLNQLFLEGLNQGAAAVLLSARFAKSLCHSSMLWKTSYVLEKHGEKTDIDMLVMADGILLTAECKNTLQPNTAQQLQATIAAARALKAELFMFATLDPGEMPAEIVRLVEKENQQSSQLVVKIVTRDDLLRGYWMTDERQRVELEDILDLESVDTGSCYDDDGRRSE
jgi:hypothetical protein